MRKCNNNMAQLVVQLWLRFLVTLNCGQNGNAEIGLFLTITLECGPIVFQNEIQMLSKLWSNCG